MVGKLSLNVLGRVPVNPIDEIFYENRGRTQAVRGEHGDVVDLNDAERVNVKTDNAGGLGPVGEAQAVAAHAILLLEEPDA